MIRGCLIVLGGLALLNPAQAISHGMGLPLISRGSTSSRSLAAQTGPASPNPQTPLIPARKFVCTDFGAVGDGKTLNTDAFRKTLAACRDAAGGEVIVPAGVFVTAPITLASHMALVIEKGATLRGSGDFRDYIKSKSGMSVRDANSVELRDVQIVPQKGEPLDITHSIVKTTKGS